MKIIFQRWPWQSSLANTSIGRFGGGWRYELGIKWGKNRAIVSLLWGQIVIDWSTHK